MIGLDTNVLVRHIMQDDAKQAAKATRLIEGLTAQVPGFITLVSVVEPVWVLSSFYELDKAKIVQALNVMLRSGQLVVDQEDIADIAADHEGGRRLRPSTVEKLRPGKIEGLLLLGATGRCRPRPMPSTP